MAVWTVTEALYANWPDLEAIYIQESGVLDEQWWDRFQRYVIVNADPELREQAEDEEFAETLRRRIERGKEEIEDGEWVTLRNVIRMTTDEGRDDGLPTLPSPDTY